MPGDAHFDDLIEARGLTKKYDGGAVQALRGVSISVRRGEIVAVVGPSGSGKSTLLHLLGALDRPTSGEIRFDGVRLDARTDLDEFRARKIGFIFQTFHLLPTLSAIQNVQIPMFETRRSPASRQARAESLLRMVGLAHRAHHLPAHLSVGERQRVAIARALANEPVAILADEPTGSLDTESSNDVMALLRSINREQGTTIVLITHSPVVAGMAHRTVQLLDGRVLAQPAEGTTSIEPLARV